MTSQPFAWHGLLSWALLGLAFACAVAIAVDVAAPSRRQQMAIMNVVYPITGLYWGPAALWFYLRHGRRGSSESRSDELRWQDTATAVTHCGAGCVLGDICAEWIVWAGGLAWFGKWSGHALPAELLLDFGAAWTFGILFQWFSIVPMHDDVGWAKGLWRAIQADTASIVAFEIGLFGWMAIFELVIWPHHGIQIDSPDFWFEMQVGMILGFFTAYPVNRLLVARGVKERM